MKRIGFILVIGLLLSLFGANIVFAGFGVTPSGVTNHKLLPGSHFEQTIYLVQSRPEEDLLTNIEIDAPEIKDWVSIDRGFEFTIPAGARQFPIKVIIDVPQDAEFKNYRGKLWIKTTPVSEEGMVTVALGAIAYLDLTVSAEEVYGFAFRGIKIRNTEEGRAIKVMVELQNVGNTEDKPTKIRLDVYDVYLKEILQSSEATKIETIKPFETKQITVKFPNKLAIGEYFGAITIYKDDKIIGDAKQAFKVVERTGFLYKIFSKWYSWVVLWAIILASFGWKRRKKLKEWFNKWKSKKLEKKRKRLEKKLRKLSK